MSMSISLYRFRLLAMEFTSEHVEYSEWSLGFCINSPRLPDSVPP